MNKEPFKISNTAYCTNCKDYIESKYRHNYVSCSCGNVSLDGGSFAEVMSVRLGNPEYIVDTSVYSDSPFEDIRNALYRNSTTLLKDMSNSWLENCISYEEQHRPNNKFLKFYYKELEYRQENNIFVEEKQKI